MSHCQHGWLPQRRLLCVHTVRAEAPRRYGNEDATAAGKSTLIAPPPSPPLHPNTTVDLMAYSCGPCAGEEGGGGLHQECPSHIPHQDPDDQARTCKGPQPC